MSASGVIDSSENAWRCGVRGSRNRSWTPTPLFLTVTVTVLDLPAAIRLLALLGRPVIVTGGAANVTRPEYGEDSTWPPAGLTTSTTNRHRPGCGDGAYTCSALVNCALPLAGSTWMLSPAVTVWPLGPTRLAKICVSGLFWKLSATLSSGLPAGTLKSNVLIWPGWNGAVAAVSSDQGAGEVAALVVELDQRAQRDRDDRGPGTAVELEILAGVTGRAWAS